MINLIKSGAFNNITDKNRKDLMLWYLCSLAKQTRKPKEKITGACLEEIAELNLINSQDKYYNRLYNFNKYITAKENEYEKIKNKTWLIAKDKAYTFFEQNYIDELTEDKDYYYAPEGIVFSKSAYNKVFKAKLDGYIETLNTPEFIEKYNETYYMKKALAEYNKYCEGTEADWEMDALSFYHSPHPLSTVNKRKYNFTSFADIPEQPVVVEEYEYKGRTFNRYQLYRICGTVLDNDRTKHMVTLLTPDNEVITLKFYAGQFINYNKKITDLDEKGKSVIKENSWFQRGNKLAIVGYRRDDQFVPKTYKNSIYKHSVAKITGITADGSLALQTLRYGEIENNWRN